MSNRLIYAEDHIINYMNIMWRLDIERNSHWDSMTVRYLTNLLYPFYLARVRDL